MDTTFDASLNAEVEVTEELETGVVAIENAKGQKGFTLIEIIAVLVILGMLAAVAIPKYLSMQQSAAQQTVTGALASGASQLSLSYSNQLLGGLAPGAALTAALADCTANYATMDDFTLTYVAGAAAGSATITITGGATATGTSVFNNLAAGAVTAKTITFQ